MSMGLGGSYVVIAARRPGRYTRRGFTSGTPQGLAGFDSTPVAPSPQNAWVDPAESAQGIRRSKGAGKRTIKGKGSPRLRNRVIRAALVRNAEGVMKVRHFHHQPRSSVIGRIAHAVEDDDQIETWMIGQGQEPSGNWHAGPRTAAEAWAA